MQLCKVYPQPSVPLAMLGSYSTPIFQVGRLSPHRSALLNDATLKVDRAFLQSDASVRLEAFPFCVSANGPHCNQSAGSLAHSFAVSRGRGSSSVPSVRQPRQKRISARNFSARQPLNFPKDYAQEEVNSLAG